jgi:hypothetical protein
MYAAFLRPLLLALDVVERVARLDERGPRYLVARDRGEDRIDGRGQCGGGQDGQRRRRSEQSERGAAGRIRGIGLGSHDWMILWVRLWLGPVRGCNLASA